MKHQSASEETQEKAALYAIGALGQHEARAFESHLRDGCSVCRNELWQFDRVVGAIGCAASDESPPPDLRGLLMSRVEMETPSRPVDVAFAGPRVTRPATYRPASFIPWSIAAAFALAAITFFFSWQQSRREAADQLRASLNKTHGGARIIMLEGQQAAPRAAGQIYWDIANNNWAVAVNLPPAPEGKVYQLWFVKPDARISAGIIRPDKNGYGFAVINVPPELGRLDAVAITLEPEGGSASPTMPIYAMGTAG